MIEKFWKVALTVGGIAAIGAFVFYSLYKDWLTLDIFEKLTSEQTFIIMLVFLVLVFFIAIAMLIAWFFGAQHTNGSVSDNSVTFTIPSDWSFDKVAKGIAQEDNSTVEFKGFSEENLSVTLKSQSLTASNTKRTLELLHGLAGPEFPRYSVTKVDGKYTISKV